MVALYRSAHSFRGVNSRDCAKCMYRDEPRFQPAYHFISSLMDIDSLLMQWRSKKIIEMPFLHLTRVITSFSIRQSLALCATYTW